MQRLFSMFPEGGPGLALVLLRFSVASSLAIWLGNRSVGPLHHVLFACLLLMSVSLAVGFLTPVLSLIAAAAAIVHLVMFHLFGGLVLVSFILNSTALALLGPGAYSLDARLFGRRVVVVSPRKGADRS